MNTLISSPPPKGPDGTRNHIRWLAMKALSGFVFGIAFVAMLLFFNIANLQTLIFGSSEKWIALFILCFFTGLTFASVQMGIAIMSEAHKDDDDDKRGRGPKVPDVLAYLDQMIAPPPEPKPIKVKATRLY